MYCSKCGADAGTSPAFCPSCGVAFAAEANAPAATHTPESRELARLKELRAKLSELEAKLPATNVLNAKFWPRAFAVLGHNLAAILVIYLAIFVVAIAVAIVVALVGAAG